MIFETGHVKRFEVREAGQSKLLQVTVSVRKWNSKLREKKTEYWKVELWGKRGEGLAQFLKEGDAVAFMGDQSIEPALYKGEPRAWLTCKAQNIEVMKPFENDRPAARPAPQPRAVVPAKQQTDFDDGFSDDLPF